MPWLHAGTADAAAVVGAGGAGHGLVFPVLGALLFGLGFAAFVGRRHMLWKIVAVNVMGSGVSMLLLTLPARADGRVDPVPQAMVLTGIVVMVAATAFALALAVRLASFPPEPADAAGPAGAPGTRSP